MSDFPFKVGDKIQRQFNSTEVLTITAIGGDRFLGISSLDEEEVAYSKRPSLLSQYGSWVLFTPPPKRYVVEVRPPKAGDKILNVLGEVFNAFAGQSDRVVIVEELA